MTTKKTTARQVVSSSSLKGDVVNLNGLSCRVADTFPGYIVVVLKGNLYTCSDKELREVGAHYETRIPRS